MAKQMRSMVEYADNSNLPRQELCRVTYLKSNRVEIEPPCIPMLSVADAIVTIAPRKANLCLFVGIYNSLRSVAERNAFTGGDSQDPTKKFLNVAGLFKTNRKRYGYNSRDVERYLRHLKKDGFIKYYDWYMSPGFSFERVLLDVDTVVAPVSYVFFGYTMNKKGKDEMRRKMLDEERRLLDLGLGPREVTHAMVNFYHNDVGKLVDRYTKNAYTHCVVLGVDGDRLVWLYDNGNTKRRRVHSIADIAPNLATYWRVYVLRLHL